MEPAQPTVASAEPLAKETRRFGTNAAFYLASNVLLRGVTLLLTPLYTRAMAPADFAIVAVANTLVAVLGIGLGLAIDSTIPRMVFEYDDQGRRRLFGTVLSFSLVVPTCLTGVLYMLGASGHLEFFATLHFEPHLKLVLLTGLFGAFIPLPQTVYVALEQPRRVAVLTLSAALCQMGFAIVFVARLHEGALGVLRANCLSAVIMGSVSLVLMFRLSTFSWALPGLGKALAFGLPLVPHLMANWALAISDRLVLERFVPAADVGRYSLAYLFNVVVATIAGSMGNALSPMATRQLKDPKMAANVPPLGTYLVATSIAAGAGVALFAGDAIRVVAPASYASAAGFVPWVVLGAVLQSFYLVWSIGTWFSMKTGLVPVITVFAGAVNIGTNLLLVPRYGVMVAAVSTAGSYALLAALHGLLAQRVHPIPWEYRRWMKVSLVAASAYALGMAVPQVGPWLAVLLKGLVFAVGLPMGLAVTRFFSAAEVAEGRTLLAGVLRRAGLPRRG